ncbi:ABC transporter substrate-binding protein [Streptococcus suis]|nr:ABC transporter substrate-binding protein [Streptococcus suis]
MKKVFKLGLAVCASLTLSSLAACSSDKQQTTSSSSEAKTIDFILDWSPNTNHTGLYVAKELGYFEEAGVNVDIKLPPEDSSSDLVINGKAPFAIYFQDSMAKKLEKGAGITAVAAIIEHNTSGIISAGSANVANPKDLEGKKYGTWNDPVELAILTTLLKDQGGDFEKVEKVPNTESNSVTPIANSMFDAAWIYQGWDGIMAEREGMDTNFFYLRDYASEFDYYSPVIIANNDYLAQNPEEAKKVLAAIKKGYQYAIKYPEESAKILIKNAPELQSQEEFVLASQKYLSGQYASDPEKWGQFDAKRWNAFYKWANENGILENDLKDKGFSNEYIN